MTKVLWLILLVIMHFAVLSFFDEYLVARHLLFRCKIKVAKIIGFGKSKLFDTMYFYTIISYCEQKQGSVVKISRSKDDEIGKEIMVAVKADGKLAVRYEKNNWYGKLFYNLEGTSLGSGLGLKGYICAYVFLNSIMACSCILEPEGAMRLYQIYLLIVIIHYLLMPQIVEIRNYLYEKNKVEDM